MEGLESQKKDVLGQIGMSSVVDVASLHVYSISIPMSLLPMAGTGLLILSLIVAVCGSKLTQSNIIERKGQVLKNYF